MKTYNSSVHSTKFTDIPTHNIGGTKVCSQVQPQTSGRFNIHHTADQLYHAVRDTRQCPDNKDLVVRSDHPKFNRRINSINFQSLQLDLQFAMCSFSCLCLCGFARRTFDP